MMMTTNEFLRGQADCAAGEEHKQGQSDDYNRGYSAQYEMDQVQAYLSGGGRG